MVYLRLKPIIPPGSTSHGKYFQLDRDRSNKQTNVNIWIWNMKITSSGLDIFPIGSRWGRVAWSRLPRCGALDKVLGGGGRDGMWEGAGTGWCLLAGHILGAEILLFLCQTTLTNTGILGLLLLSSALPSIKLWWFYTQISWNYVMYILNFHLFRLTNGHHMEF